MKKILRVLAAIFILNSTFFVLNSNGQWLQQPPMNLSLKFNCVRFLNWQIGFLGGGGGQILKTVNYGANWYSQSTYTDLDVGNLLFFDFNTGFAMCGSSLTDSSKILRTTNGGFVWDIKYTGHHIVFTKGIHFINSNTGYVSGMSDNDSAIIKTTDGGWTWQKTKTNTVKGIEKFSFIDVNTGFAAAYGTDSKACILKTTNGGISWAKTYVHPTALKFASVYFINSNTGWVVGSSASDNSLILKTTNSGINWVDQYNQHPANQKLNDIQMLNENTGWIVGDASQIVKTTNGGLNWRAQTNPAGSFSAIEFRGPDTGYVAGSIGYDGLLLKTHNGGGSVSVQNINSEIPASYSLGQNYPNPFNPITKIKFDIAKFPSFGGVPEPAKRLAFERRGGLVTLKIYNITGREVQTLVNERLQAGTYEATFDGSALNSGVYFYKLITEGFSETKKMLLLK